MITNDFINGGFELCGGLMIIPSILNLLKTKSADGVALSTVTFFTIWGLWNIYYYPAMDQPLSAAAAMMLTAANMTWWALVFKYKVINKREAACASS